MLNIVVRRVRLVNIYATNIQLVPQGLADLKQNVGCNARGKDFALKINVIYE